MSPHVLFSLTATATAVALAGLAPALGQTLPSPAQGGPAVAQVSPEPTYTLIHVSAAVGSDSRGDGSQLRPYQTITHALQGAAVNSIVVLAAGEYSEASGERFPIQLKAGVTVQGAPGAGPGQTVIRGSGILPSPTEGLVHATVVGVDGAGLGHVTVTNTSTSGYGLVIEAGRPVIRQNVFVGSGYGGVYVGGQSAPVIEGNQFRQNGVVGLAIAGQSTAEVRNNRFEQTGIGIRVAPGANHRLLTTKSSRTRRALCWTAVPNPACKTM
ncbi:MAG: DUF1565 domain-containing protein [Leptolyngbyaceae cyanobacterium SM2_5_2]|nr:DUF1565 domain-containing protein [Leptolyngbyaceae cyanobacterium SM2_5_2]